MTGAPETKSVRYLGVELGADGAAEWLDGRRAVFVAREAVIDVELRRGIAGERPVLQFVLGGGALVLGAALLFTLAGVLDGAWSPVAARFAAAGVPLSILGAWVLWTGARPAYYLRVRTALDARKLLLARRVDLPELSTALHEASRRFGYRVSWALDDPRPPTSTLPTVASPVASASAGRVTDHPQPSPRLFPQTEHGESDAGGIQWGNVAPLVGIFVASWLVASFFGDPTRGWADRGRAALASAATMFVGSMIGVWLLSRFVHHSRLSSWRAFAIVWGIVVVVWLVVQRS
jgi:hypothetical protein